MSQACSAIPLFNGFIGPPSLRWRARLLRMYALRIAGRLTAVHYGLGDGRCAYYYLGGFEPELRTLAPGVLIVGHAIEEAAREGAREFHFLRGREAYKYAWGAVDRASHARRLVWNDGGSAKRGVSIAR